MEFTTRFGLHSQTTRLREDRTPARRGPLPASHRPRAEPRSEGLRPPSDTGQAVFRTPFPTSARPDGDSAARLFPLISRR
ncbi:translation initiation factor IF-2-like protein [Lates japonicus]|uniref:Translation initiation factor IF-2-like protein n=1 Tax=Lates japonicus TaxID=270547 RepID=A0AAD3MV30_LATJO|nr:translation initiation factor IF-2-like protein [Lates japonicus]